MVMFWGEGGGGRKGVLDTSKIAMLILSFLAPVELAAVSQGAD